MKVNIFVYIFLIVLLSSIVMAEDFKVDEIRLYVNEDRQEDADIAGGELSAYRDDKIAIRVDIENNFSVGLRNIDVFFTADSIKRNGDDIEITREDIEINNGDEQKISMQFDVPSDAIYDVYDLKLKIRGEFENGTDLSDWTQTWDLDILEKEEKINDTKSIDRMADACIELIVQDRTILDKLTALPTTITDSNKNLFESYKTDCNNNLVDTKTKLDTCTTDLENEKTTTTSLRVNIENRLTRDDCNKEITKSKKDAVFVWQAIVVIGVIGGFIFFRKKQKVKSSDESMPRYPIG